MAGHDAAERNEIARAFSEGEKVTGEDDGRSVGYRWGHDPLKR